MDDLSFLSGFTTYLPMEPLTSEDLIEIERLLDEMDKMPIVTHHDTLLYRIRTILKRIVFFVILFLRR